MGFEHLQMTTPVVESLNSQSKILVLALFGITLVGIKEDNIRNLSVPQYPLEIVLPSNTLTFETKMPII